MNQRAKAVAALTTLVVTPLIVVGATSRDTYQASPGIPQILFEDPKKLVHPLTLSAANLPWSQTPDWESRPGSANTLYLDFKGEASFTTPYYQPTSAPPFDLDGDPTTVSPTELAAMQEIWERVAEAYAVFDLNVVWKHSQGQLSMSDAGKVGKILIGPIPSASGGGMTGSIGSFFRFISFMPPYSYVFTQNLANNAKYIGECAAHEAGHQFGLQHQSLWSGNTLAAVYRPGDANIGPFMGTPYSSKRGVWALGPGEYAANQLQDDLLILGTAIAGYPGHLNYIPDESPPAGETCMHMGTPTDQSIITASGLISNTADVDCYEFAVGADDQLTVALSPWHDHGGTGDFAVSLETPEGDILASDTRSNEALKGFTQVVDSGVYRISVKSIGQYGDIGSYKVSVQTGDSKLLEVPAGPPARPNGLYAVKTNDEKYELHWVDNSVNEKAFVVEISTDGGKTFHSVKQTSKNIQTVTLSNSDLGL